MRGISPSGVKHWDSYLDSYFVRPLAPGKKQDVQSWWLDPLPSLSTRVFCCIHEDPWLYPQSSLTVYLYLLSSPFLRCALRMKPWRSYPCEWCMEKHRLIKLQARPRSGCTTRQARSCRGQWQPQPWQRPRALFGSPYHSSAHIFQKENFVCTEY